MEKIKLDHGSGGKISHSLISETLLPAFDNPLLAQLDDGAVFNVPKGRMAFSTDTYVVDPIFFPGGDIGDLAVNGTVNDVAMCGAVPLYLSTGLIIEEGFPVPDLKKILTSMGDAARKAGVSIVTGDTKVVPKGMADKIFINTSGVGIIPEGIDVSGQNARKGDKVIITGTLADHGMTVLTRRQELRFDAPLESDSAALNHMVKALLDAFGSDVHVLRDPTRGGLATTLNEIAGSSDAGIRIYESVIPVKDAVAGICEMLGFDPLYVANEGKMLVFIKPDLADAALEKIRQMEFGEEAAIIGEVTDEHPGKVVMETRIGGSRIVDMLAGEQLPRIC